MTQPFAPYMYQRVASLLLEPSPSWSLGRLRTFWSRAATRAWVVVPRVAREASTSFGGTVWTSCSGTVVPPSAVHGKAVGVMVATGAAATGASTGGGVGCRGDGGGGGSDGGGGGVGNRGCGCVDGRRASSFSV